MKDLLWQFLLLLLAPQLAFGAFPQVVSTSTGEEASDTATHPMNIAGLSTITPGNRITCFAGFDCNSADANCPVASVTVGTGWTLEQLNNGPSNFNVLSAWATKIADGSDSLTLGLSGGTTNTQQSTHICVQTSGTGDISGTGLASSGSGNFNAPEHTCDGGSADNLFLVFRAGDANTADSQMTACPTDYDDLLTEDATNTAGTHTALCRQELADDADDPANLVMTSEQWVAWTLCMEPAAAASGGGAIILEDY